MAIKHAFTSSKVDGVDTTIVRPIDWNADHVGRGSMANMPDGASGLVLTAQGAGVDPAYAIVNLPRNKGRMWIAHGDNIITLPNAHPDANYHAFCNIYLPAMGGITTRGPTHTNPLTLTTIAESGTRLKVRLHGGFGFTSCGYTTAAIGTTERFDDVANTHTARTAATEIGRAHV